MSDSQVLAALSALPRWKKLFLGFATVLLSGGLALKGVSALVVGGEVEPAAPPTAKTAPPPRPGGSEPGDAAGTPEILVTGLDESNLVPGGPARDPEPAVTDEPPPSSGAGEEAFLDEWSPAMVKGGLSFFVCFCVGYALRTFARLSAIGAGVVFLTIFLLSYAGWIEPQWHKIQSDYDGLLARLSGEFTGFKDFLQGSLPSAGMAGVGLVAGFKKK